MVPYPTPSAVSAGNPGSHYLKNGFARVGRGDVLLGHTAGDLSPLLERCFQVFPPSLADAFRLGYLAEGCRLRWRREKRRERRFQN